MSSSLRLLANISGEPYRSAFLQGSIASSALSKIPSKSLIRRALCTAVETPEQEPEKISDETRTKNLERIADELLRLSKTEHKEYAALLRQKMGLQPWGSVSTGPQGLPLGPDGKEKTVYDVKLLDFDLISKFEVIEKIREFSYLSPDEVYDLVERTPAVVKTGVPKEEAYKIMKKLRDVGATVVLV